MVTEDDVRRLALSLDHTTEKPSYGMPGFRVEDKLFARMKEDAVLVVYREGEDEKEALIESEPDKFFTTPHYDGYPMVLVRLDAIDEVDLLDLLEESWHLRNPPG